MMKFKLLRKLFKDYKMAYEFKKTKVKTIEDKINLKEVATTDGKNNLPRSASETFSNCENEAIVNADEIRNEEVENSVAYLNTIKNKIIDSTAKLGQQNFYLDNFKNRIQQTLTTAEGRLSNLKSSFTTHNNEKGGPKSLQCIYLGPYFQTAASGVFCLVPRKPQRRTASWALSWLHASGVFC